MSFCDIMERMEQTQTRPETSPKDFFLHLLSIVALYASAASFSTLLFQCINAWFPDAVAGYGFSFSASAIRWAVAMLIVFFPTYVWTNIFLNKGYIATPEKRELHVRKWLLYFTLFVAALFILGDLVALILNFMQGELTVRFALKVLVILFVAGSVFGYYLWELKNAEFTGKVKAFIYAISVVMLAGVVAGFFVAGSPYQERMRRFDETRVNDLSMIQSQLFDYWMRTGTIPEALSGLQDDLRGFAIPLDPETQAEYTYKKTGESSFSLCAVFETVTSNTDSSGLNETPARVVQTPFGISWPHGEGAVCFDRTIDPKLYPPQGK